MKIYNNTLNLKQTQYPVKISFMAKEPLADTS